MKEAVLAVLFLAMSGFCTLFLLEAKKRGDTPRACVLKTLASLCFLAVGVYGVIQKADGLTVMVAVALLLGVVGDALLAVNGFAKTKDLFFVVGAVSFCIEHVVLITRFGILNPWSLLLALGFCLLAFPVALLYTKKEKVDGGKLQHAGEGYIAFVVFMAGSAVGTAILNFSLPSLLFAVAGLLFTASDLILSVRMFGKDKRFLLTVLLHIYYYLAQFLIATSLLY